MPAMADRHVSTLLSNESSGTFLIDSFHTLNYIPVKSSVPWIFACLAFDNFVQVYQCCRLLSSCLAFHNNINSVYCGFYSNVCRGKRKKEKNDEADFIIRDDEHTKGCNKSQGEVNLRRFMKWIPLSIPSVDPI